MYVLLGIITCRIEPMHFPALKPSVSEYVFLYLGVSEVCSLLALWLSGFASKDVLKCCGFRLRWHSLPSATELFCVFTAVDQGEF